MIQSHLSKSSVSLFSSMNKSSIDYTDAFDEQYPYHNFDRIRTRIVWVTNYTNNEECMYYPID